MSTRPHLFYSAVLDRLVRARIFDTPRLIFPNTLTVLNYHRIDDPHQTNFDTFKPNVSATPQDFARQMDYVKEVFSVITCDHLVAWLHGEKSLPPRAAIITFDDGYYDNLSNAFPVLQERNLPAVIFLTTDFIGTVFPFYWDYVAYCFFHTEKETAHLPLTGTCSWRDQPSRRQVLHTWIEALKGIPEVEKQQAIRQIGQVLDVTVPVGAFANLYLNWEQVRAMSRSGLIEFGTHTMRHPILTRISLEQAKKEIEGSKRRLEEELGRSVVSMAYPNGSAADFSPGVMMVAKEVGIEMAFTLLAGPTRYATVRKNPLAIRRIPLHYSDTFERFVRKLSGFTRLVGR